MGKVIHQAMGSQSKIPSDNRRLDLADQASLGHDLTLRFNIFLFLQKLNFRHVCLL